MAEAELWPPASPMKALLSSPSGRKKFRDYQDTGASSTSPEKLLGSPSLLEKLRAARANRDHEILPITGQDQRDMEDDEDEETLQLKLQAIEAKLKLKRLKQQKVRNAETTQPRDLESTAARLQVALSPAKRITEPPSFKSPSRVLLGIDKGLNAADVSLKRARIINGSPTKLRPQHVESRLSRPFSRPNTANPTPTKSFSEKMAEIRDRERGREQKQSALQHARSLNFRLDKEEVKSYYAAAESEGRPSSSVQTLREPEDPASDRKKKIPTKSRLVKHSHSMPSLRSTSPSSVSTSVQTRPQASPVDGDENKGNANLYEGFSGIHLTTRILPHTFLKRTLPSDQFKIYTIPKLLKDVTSPDYQIPDHVTDYVVFGIIAAMSKSRDHKAKPGEVKSVASNEWEKKWDDGSANRQKFMVATLTDLKWEIQLFLFGSAVPRYHRLAPGTLIAILNPGIMPPKRGQEDTGAFSLTLHDGEDQILEIGRAKHLGHCTAKKKDGQECGYWVNSNKTSICEFHLNAQINRTRGSRSGINKMDGWKPDLPKEKEKARTHRRGYDWESQSLYYAVGGVAPKKTVEERWSFAPTHNPNISTAKLLDSTNPDDPFLAEGQMLERDKQDRLRKRMAAMAKEHEIAKKLGKIGTGAGSEYMRKQTEDPNAPRPSMSSLLSGGQLKSAITKEDIMADRPGEKGKKRAADSVRLSPVKKKTRFVTEKGIKLAGRESLGHTSDSKLTATANDTKRNDVIEDYNGSDDDDLDII